MKGNYKNDAYFGVCPTCGDNDGYLNIHKDHWFICHEHRVRWHFGTNLFSSWRQESEADWRENQNRIGPYRDIEGEGGSMHPRERAELRAGQIRSDRAELDMIATYGGSLLRAVGIHLRLASRIVADRALTALDAPGRPFCAFGGQRDHVPSTDHSQKGAHP